MSKRIDVLKSYIPASTPGDEVTNDKERNSGESTKNQLGQWKIGNVAGEGVEGLENHQNATMDYAKNKTPLSREDRTVDFTGATYMQTIVGLTSILQTKKDAANLPSSKYKISHKTVSNDIFSHESGNYDEILQSFDTCYTIVKCGDLELPFILNSGLGDSQTGNSVLFFYTSGGGCIPFRYKQIYYMKGSEGKRLSALSKIKEELNSESTSNGPHGTTRIKRLMFQSKLFYVKEKSFLQKVENFYIKKGSICLKFPEGEERRNKMKELYRDTWAQHREKSKDEVYNFFVKVENFYNDVVTFSQTKEPMLVESLRSQVKSLYDEVNSSYEEKRLYLRFLFCLEASRRFVVDGSKERDQRRDIYFDLPILPAVALALAVVDGDFGELEFNYNVFKCIFNCFSKNPKCPSDDYEGHKIFRMDSINNLIEKCRKKMRSRGIKESLEELVDNVLGRHIKH